MDCSLTAVGAEAFAKMFTDHRGTWMPHLAKLSLGYNRYRCRGQTAGATWCHVVPRSTPWREKDRIGTGLWPAVSWCGNNAATSAPGLGSTAGCAGLH